MSEPVIAVLCGGTSRERAVSLDSGRACALALVRSLPTRLLVVEQEALPPGLDPARDVVFSTLHGTFGEDGGMQRLLDGAGFTYAGCDAASSALTMDKARTKQVAAGAGIGVPRGLVFGARQKPAAEEVIGQLGPSVVVKPNDEGSSVGLSLPASPEELAGILARIDRGVWLIEERISGRELSVGVLDGRALGVVEVRPKSGVYDYASKYTRGLTEYLAPAPLDEEAAGTVRQAAETAFAACGCRDYARVDFIFREGGVYLLEINTLPGMKETSLLPMSASCAGLDFTGLVREMVGPALRRFHPAALLLR